MNKSIEPKVVKSKSPKAESQKSRVDIQTIKNEIMNKISLKIAVYGLLGALFVTLSGLVVYFYFQYTNTKAQLKSKTSAEKEVADQLVNRVSKLIELPKETATIATVSDKKKLTSQPFFNRAENGDKVLIYSAAKKAILYRPSTNKIIEVGPISVSETEATPPASSSASGSL